MGNLLHDQREVILIAVAISAVIVPFLIGLARKQIPADVFFRWALPLALSTGLLVVGIRLFNRHLDQNWKLSLSLLFGVLWLVAGFQLRWRSTRTPSAQQVDVEKAGQLIGLLLLGFGFLWTAITLLRYYLN